MKRVVLISAFTFENRNYAAINRMINYAISLKAENIEFIFTSILEKSFFTLDENLELKKQGTLKNQLKASSKIYTLLLKDFPFKASIKYIKEIYREFSYKNEQTVFLYYPGGLALYFISIGYLRLLKKQKVFLEKNEMHVAVRLNYEAPHKIMDKAIFYVLQVLLLPVEFVKDILMFAFDGVIAISTNIKKLYEKFGSNSIRVPILAFPKSAYIKQQPQSSYGNKHFNIGFFGAIADSKDRIYDVLKAISVNDLLKSKIVLNLFGSYNKSTKHKIGTIINNYALKDNVNLMGSVPNQIALSEMKKCDLLLLLRSDNMQNRYGFSTKLAEYCMTGTPTLITDVSDIPMYFSDRQNGFILKSIDLGKDSIAKKLLEIIRLPKKDLVKIGDNARQTYNTYFDPYSYTERLANFLF